MVVPSSPSSLLLSFLSVYHYFYFSSILYSFFFCLLSFLLPSPSSSLSLPLPLYLPRCSSIFFSSFPISTSLYMYLRLALPLSLALSLERQHMFSGYSPDVFLPSMTYFIPVNVLSILYGLKKTKKNKIRKRGGVGSSPAEE